MQWPAILLVVFAQGLRLYSSSGGPRLEQSFAPRHPARGNAPPLLYADSPAIGRDAAAASSLQRDPGSSVAVVLAFALHGAAVTQRKLPAALSRAKVVSMENPEAATPIG